MKYKPLLFFALLVLAALFGYALLREGPSQEKPESANDIKQRLFSVVDETLAQTPVRNPKIWDGDKLRPEIRKQILDYAEQFKADGYDKAVATPEKLLLVGGIAGFNTTRFSDMDLHMIMDFDKSIRAREVVSFSLYWRKKFARKYPKKIAGFPVEIAPVSAVDSAFQAKSGNKDNLYDVQTDTWIKKQPGPWPELDIDKVKREAYGQLLWARKELDSHMGFKNYDECKKIAQIAYDLDNFRQENHDGRHYEMNFGNMVYKSLRNFGLIKQVRTARRQCVTKFTSQKRRRFEQLLDEVSAQAIIDGFDEKTVDAAFLRTLSEGHKVLDYKETLDNDNLHLPCWKVTARLNDVIGLRYEGSKEASLSFVFLERTGLFGLLHVLEKRCILDQLDNPIIYKFGGAK